MVAGVRAEDLETPLLRLRDMRDVDELPAQVVTGHRELFLQVPDSPYLAGQIGPYGLASNLLIAAALRACSR